MCEEEVCEEGVCEEGVCEEGVCEEGFANKELIAIWLRFMLLLVFIRLYTHHCRFFSRLIAPVPICCCDNL